MRHIKEQHETIGGQLVTVYWNGAIVVEKLTDEQYFTRRLEERWAKQEKEALLNKDTKLLSNEKESGSEK